MNDERLIAITLGKGEEIEKEPMRCMKGHDYVKKDGARRDQSSSATREQRQCVVCKKTWFNNDNGV